MDGIFSAIVAYNQLLKQGIPKDKITFKGIQYGEDSELGKMLRKNGKQAAVLVDFARLSDKYMNNGKREITNKPDFWSDHHEMPAGYVKGEKEDKRLKKIDPEYKKQLAIKKKELMNKMAKEGKQFSARNAAGIGTDFSSDTDHLATLHTNNLIDGATLKAINRIDSADFTNLKDVFLLKKDFKSKGRMERLAIITNALLAEKGYYRGNEGLVTHLIKSSAPSLVSVYNNLIKQIRLSDIQKEGLKELTKTNPNWKKVNEIRMMMPNKHSRNAIQKGRIKTRDSDLFRKENANKIRDWEIARKEKEHQEKIKNKKPFGSRKKKIYEGAYEDEKKIRLIDKILKDPDTYINNLKQKRDKYLQLSKQNPFEVKYKAEADKLNKRIKSFDINNIKKERQDLIKKPLSIIQGKREASLKKATNNYSDKEKAKLQKKKKKADRDKPIKSAFKTKDGIMKPPQGTQRYLWALLNKNGERTPFVIKKMGSMIQVSANPDLPEGIKNKIDLNKIAQDILKEIKGEYKHLGWAFDIIEKESGGHKTITNISNLHLLKSINKDTSAKRRELQSFERRLDNLKNYGSSRSRKLSPEDRTRLRSYKQIVKNITKKAKPNDKVAKIINDYLEETEKKNPDYSKIKEYFDWRRHNSKMPIWKQTVTDEDKKVLKNALNKIKILEPKFNEYFPEKAKELEDIRKIEEEQKAKIVNKIVKRFEEKVRELIKQHNIKLKDNDERFRIREEILSIIKKPVLF